MEQRKGVRADSPDSPRPFVVRALLLAGTTAGKELRRTRRHDMNQDILQGKWNELKGRVKETWGKLTSDDLDKIDGNTERLLGVLQQRYGYARDKAEAEFNRFTSAQGSSWTATKSKSTTSY